MLGRYPSYRGSIYIYVPARFILTEYWWFPWNNETRGTAGTIRNAGKLNANGKSFYVFSLFCGGRTFIFPPVAVMVKCH